jgi:hypothetical protein
MQFNAATDHNLITDLTIGQLLGIIATLIVIVTLIRTINPIMKRLNNLLDDWFGEPPRPGVPERKGVMQRMEDQDEVLGHLRRRIEPLVDETAEGNHQEVLRKLSEIHESSNANNSRLRTVERLLHRHLRESRSWVQQVDKAAAEVNFQMPPWPTIVDEEDESSDI